MFDGALTEKISQHFIDLSSTRQTDIYNRLFAI